MKILLACSLGMSTSLLVSHMKKEAKAQGKDDYEIWATDVNSIDDEEGFEVIMLGPQVSSRYQEVNEEFDVPVRIIEKQDYGRCDGAAVLAAAEKAVQEGK